MGESTDGDSNDDQDDSEVKTSPQEDDVECNFTFIGANVQMGKSSMRSKPKAKKVCDLYWIERPCSNGRCYLL